jgi:hypothetical protein
LACPYFIPVKRCESELWRHRARLPLGDGYEGRCGAPGYEAAAPTEDQLKTGCNLGNSRCSRLPEDRAHDSVRFHVRSDQGVQLTVSYCAERDHHPRASGLLQFDAASGNFVAATAEASLLRLAHAFVQSHFLKHPRTLSART